MNVRTATQLDKEAIHQVHWSAFAADERALVSELAVNLLSEETVPKTISLVAELEGIVVGHVAFSPVTIDNDEPENDEPENDETFRGFILAPLGILPDYQKRGIGTKLVERGMQLVSEKGADILLVYGDPNYYGRFGFSADAAEGYRPPYKLEYPFGWQAIALNNSDARTTSADLVFVTALSNPALW